MNTLRVWKLLTLLATCLLALGCDDEEAEEEEVALAGQVLTIGDSIIEWNAWSDQAIADFIADETGLDVANGGISGATVLDDGPEGIPNQYVSSNWEWVVVEGGANDLGDGCGCNGCEATLDAIITEDGTSGAIPVLLDEITADGARIVLLGYYRVPAGSEFDGCDDEFDTLDARYASLAASRDNVIFFDMGSVADLRNDPSLVDEDGIHPSPAGSEAVGRGIGRLILAGGQ